MKLLIKLALSAVVALGLMLALPSTASASGGMNGIAGIGGKAKNVGQSVSGGAKNTGSKVNNKPSGNTCYVVTCKPQASKPKPKPVVQRCVCAPSKPVAHVNRPAPAPQGQIVHNNVPAPKMEKPKHKHHHHKVIKKKVIHKKVIVKKITKIKKVTKVKNVVNVFTFINVAQAQSQEQEQSQSQLITPPFFETFTGPPSVPGTTKGGTLPESGPGSLALILFAVLSVLFYGRRYLSALRI